MSGYDASARERWVAERAKAAPRAERSPFARDRARVLHSASLRRLAGKTQVVEVSNVDVPRTRLTHSLECAQIGREMADALGADPDLVDAACLAHDLGHPPFGHNGEAALNEIAQGSGGFEGNAQSLRLLTRLEVKLAGAGLNLTRATLDASCKYPWPRPEAGGKFGVYADDLTVFRWLREGAPRRRQSFETQLMDWADDVAYSVHDFEDAVHARLLDPGRIDVAAVLDACRSWYLPDVTEDVLGECLASLRAHPWFVRSYDGGPPSSVVLKRMTSELIGRFSGAAIDATRDRYGDCPLYRYEADLVVPQEVLLESALLKAVTVHYVVFPQSVRRDRQRELIGELVALVLDRAPESLDPLFRPAFEAASDDAGRLRVAIDQVASLTDAGAVAWHARLSDW